MYFDNIEYWKVYPFEHCLFECLDSQYFMVVQLMMVLSGYWKMHFSLNFPLILIER